MERQHYERIPCGCELWNEGPDGVVFVYKPCSPTCQYYLYAIEQSRAQGNTIEFRQEA